MELETGTRAIVALAWARRLGLADSALDTDAAPTARTRILHRDDDANKAVFLRLMGRSVLSGPAWLHDAAADFDDEELAEESVLLRLVRARAGSAGSRGEGESTLYYLDEPLTVAESSSTLVSLGGARVRELEALCPQDDLAGVRLSARDKAFTLVSEKDNAPLAGAGYSIVEGIVADLATLTVPHLRRHGLGAYISAVAADEALASGLVPQWRAAVSNRAAHLTADALGFIHAGSITRAGID